jgi:RNA recognition motif-containing protein
MDVNLPRDKETGKTKGFGFLMYEDARSCVLAVDNLGGAKVLDRTLRVDHVANYRQSKVKGEDGEMAEREEPSMNARPDMVEGTSHNTFAMNTTHCYFRRVGNRIRRDSTPGHRSGRPNA